MEIDFIENEIVSQPPAIHRRRIRPVDDAHPFDLDAYISGYSGVIKTPSQFAISTKV